MKTLSELFIFSILFILIGNFSFSQIPSIEWEHSLGGDSIEQGFSIRQTADGGYFVGGGTASNNGDVSGNHGGFDYWIAKLDAGGNMLWQKCLGGSADDEVQSFDLASDGGYIIAGYSYSNDGDITSHHGTTSEPDCWIVKTDSSGNIQWEKSLGGSDADKALSIRETSDGGFIFNGFTASVDGDVSGQHGGDDYWTVKLDSAGNIDWQRCLGGSFDEQGYSAEQTPDAGFILGGWAQSTNGDVTGNHGLADYWVVKLDSSGSVAWEKSLGGTDNDKAFAVQMTSDGGYIVAGLTLSDDGDVTVHYGNWDYWIVKLNASGAIDWQKSYGGTLDEVAISIQQTSDNGFVINGFTESDDIDVSGLYGLHDYWIVKIDSAANIEWQKCAGGSQEDKGYSILQTPGEGYILAGHTSSDNGDVTGNHGDYDIWVVRLNFTTAMNDDIDLHSAFFLSPNPAHEAVTLVFSSQHEKSITIRLLDMLGRELFEENIDQSGSFSKQLDLRNFPPGTYLAEVICNGKRQVQKLVITE